MENREFTFEIKFTTIAKFLLVVVLAAVIAFLI
jgi:hypothetical protein